MNSIGRVKWKPEILGSNIHLREVTKVWGLTHLNVVAELEDTFSMRLETFTSVWPPLRS